MRLLFPPSLLSRVALLLAMAFWLAAASVTLASNRPCVDDTCCPGMSATCCIACAPMPALRSASALSPALFSPDIDRPSAPWLAGGITPEPVLPPPRA